MPDAQKLDAARDELKTVETQLRAARKILKRDWPQMSPRERSSQSRVVKELEERQRILTDEIEILNASYHA